MSNRLGFIQSISFSFIVSLSSLLILALPVPVNAEMKQLSEIQNALFYLNPKTMEFTAETSITDNFIDDEQLDYFIYSSATEPFLPADGNYSYSVIDFNALYSDLVIIYKYDSIACCPYPAKAYLSRHNISISDFTDQKIPPPVVMNVVKGYEPYHNDKVTALVFCINNFEATIDESIRRYRLDGCEEFGQDICHPGVCEQEVVECNSCLPKSNCTTTKQPIQTGFSTNALLLGSSDKSVGAGVGYLSNVYMKVISGRVAVWRSKFYPKCLEEPTKINSCLPPSDQQKPKKPIYLVRVSSGNPCYGEPFWPEPPKQTCVWGPPPTERATPAAVNWSYNYNRNPDFMKSDISNQNNNSASNWPSSSDNYCPTCK
jgi:hypothetical protein